VVVVQHAGDAVKPESIELVFFHPEAKVAEQETQHFMTSVVEQSAVPKLVASLYTLVKVEMVAAIKHVQAVQYIFGCMAVDNIEQDSNTHPMSSIDQFFQVVWGPVATAGRKEAVDLIAKACIVCVLHNGHQLNHVVSQVLNPGEDVLCELLVGSDFGLR